MTNCPQCSASIDDDLRECPVCAEPLTVVAADGVTADLAADVPMPETAADSEPTSAAAAGIDLPTTTADEADGTRTTGEVGDTAWPSGYMGDHPTPGAPPTGGPVPPAPTPPQYRQTVAVAPITHPSGLSSEVRTFALLTHLSAFAASILGFSFVGPLIMWLIKREEHPFLDHHGREALNFNLSILLYAAIGVALSLVTLGIGLIAVIPAGIVIGIMWFVTTIIAATKANNGEGYRYPLSIRFIKE